MQEYFEIGQIVNTFGVKGFVKVKPFTDDLERFEEGTVVTKELLIESGLVKKELDGIKILGNGELTKKLTVTANQFSKSAEEAIKAVGGTTEVI